MKTKVLALLLFLSGIACTHRSSRAALEISGHSVWLSGHDPETIQLLPAQGNDARSVHRFRMIAHVKFKVVKYGEVSIAINPSAPSGVEALRADLSAFGGVEIEYKSNQEVVLQLRQTGVHGGIHNSVTLAASGKYRTVFASFGEFKGGLHPLDLTDVAKFNFAFLGNNPDDTFSELKVRKLAIRP